MKKRTSFVLLALVIGLAACGTAASPMLEDRQSVSPPALGGAPEVMMEEVMVYATAAPSSYDTSKGSTSSTEPIEDRKVIMNADLTIVIPDPSLKAQEITDLAERLGGFVVSLNMYQTYLYDGGIVPEGYISIRIPADKLDSALEAIKADVVEVRNETRSTQDVTAEYVDLESRLSALEVARDQLELIMAEANKTEDVLNVFSQLQYYNEQIELVKGQMKYYDEASAFSLITVTLVAEETIQPIQIGPWTPGEAARDAIQSLIRFLQGFVDFLLYFVILGLPIILVVFGPIVLVIWLIIRGVRRRKAKKASASK